MSGERQHEPSNRQSAETEFHTNPDLTMSDIRICRLSIVVYLDLWARAKGGASLFGQPRRADVATGYAARTGPDIQIDGTA